MADVLYLNIGDTGDGPANALYTVDVTTGAATFVGYNGSTTGFGIDGLAYIEGTVSVVPEPATAALGMIGLGALALISRRRR